SRGVVRLQFVIADRPRRRNAAMVPNLSEVFFPEAEQGGPIKLRISTDVVVSVRMQFLAVLIAPLLFCVVLGVDVDRLRVPVIFFSSDVVPPLKDQDALTGRGQFVGESSAASTGPDDDHVELPLTVHGRISLSFAMRCFECALVTKLFELSD